MMLTPLGPWADRADEAPSQKRRRGSKRIRKSGGWPRTVLVHFQFEKNTWWQQIVWSIGARFLAVTFRSGVTEGLGDVGHINACTLCGCAACAGLLWHMCVGLNGESITRLPVLPPLSPRLWFGMYYVRKFDHY